MEVTFVQGPRLDPPPPKASRHPDVRYLDIPEGAEFSEALADWIAQAARLPGVKM